MLQPSPLRGSGCNTLSHSGLANVNIGKRMFYPLIITALLGHFPLHLIYATYYTYKLLEIYIIILFVCLDCGLTSQSTTMVMSRWSVIYPHFSWTCLDQGVNQYSAHIISLVTDNSPPGISRRRRMTVENIS